jgi:hypothetical protein
VRCEIFDIGYRLSDFRNPLKWDDPIVAPDDESHSGGTKESGVMIEGSRQLFTPAVYASAKISSR